MYRKPISQNTTAAGQERTEQELTRKNIPKDWLTLLESENTYFYPANGNKGFSNEMLLAQYVSAGGQLTTNGTYSQQSRGAHQPVQLSDIGPRTQHNSIIHGKKFHLEYNLDCVSR